MAFAQAPRLLGEEFQVNTYTTSSQGRAAVATSADGNFMVVWQTWAEQDGSGSAVFARRYDAAGEPVGGEFQVNTTTTGDQGYPAVAADGEGRFVVVWAGGEESPGIFGQRYDGAGDPLGGEFQIDEGSADVGPRPAVAADNAGKFVAVWTEEQDPPGSEILARRYDAAGEPAGPSFLVNSYTTGSQGLPAVSADAAGAFVVVWSSSEQDGWSLGVFGQRYDAAGEPAGGEFRVNTFTPGYQAWPAVASAADGGFVVTWMSDGQDGWDFGIFAQRYDLAGVPLGGEFQVNTHTPEFQLLPDVTVAPGGDFVIVWTDYDDGSIFGNFGQSFDADGNALGEEFLVNLDNQGDQNSPAIAADGHGRLVAVWSGQDGSFSGIRGQRFATLIFVDGFESGDTAAWDRTVR